MIVYIFAEMLSPVLLFVSCFKDTLAHWHFSDILPVAHQGRLRLRKHHALNQTESYQNSTSLSSEKNTSNEKTSFLEDVAVSLNQSHFFEKVQNLLDFLIHPRNKENSEHF